ncbi:MAG: glycosyltransferase [Actinomycetota bacterium]|nr:glycosyltransferase [Actinomycetota bacterium]
MGTVGRLNRLAGGVRHELRLVRELRPRVGLRRALAHRIRTNLDLDEALGRLDAAARTAEDLSSRVRRLELHDRIGACETWIRLAAPSDSLITVVMATRDRADLVTRAISSVQAQTHRNWELLVVYDASNDETASVLAAVRDSRVRVLQGEGKGLGAARNIGLDQARGAVIAYLDDDNTMMPAWLAAVAWAFDNNSEAELLYGALIVERMWDPLPALNFEPFDAELLAQKNFIDTSALAHRRELTGARWSPEDRYRGVEDWELALRLTAHRPPMALPVRAAVYRTSAPNRLTDHPATALARAEVLQRRQNQRRSETGEGPNPPRGDPSRR